MPELDELKKRLEMAALGVAVAKKNLLQALGLPTGAKLTVQRLPAGARLIIDSRVSRHGTIDYWEPLQRFLL